MTENFQDGCDTIVAGCTTYGATPTSNSPTDIVNAIKKIYTDRYNSGVTNGSNAGYPDSYNPLPFSVYDNGGCVISPVYFPNIYSYIYSGLGSDCSLTVNNQYVSNSGKTHFTPVTSGFNILKIAIRKIRNIPRDYNSIVLSKS